MLNTDEKPETDDIAATRKETRSTRAKRFFGPDGPMEGVTTTWKIIFVLCAVGLFVVWNGNRYKGPATVIQNTAPAVEAPAPAAVAPVINPLAAFPYPLTAAAEQMIVVCDNNEAGEFCAIDAVRAQAVTNEVWLWPGADLCDARFTIDRDVNVSVSFTDTPDMVRLFDCAPVDAFDGVTLIEGGELGGVDVEELGGE